MLVGTRCALWALYVSTSGARLFAQVNTPPAVQIRVTLLGTAAGPPVRIGTARLVDACRGADVLIHEVIDEEIVRKNVKDAPLVESIVARHTTPEQAADIFQAVRPRLAPRGSAVR